MNRSFKAVPVAKDVFWVGAVDWSIRDFHGYATQNGTTYNAYLVMADKVTLVDTVKSHFSDELLARVASVVDPSRIDYIVSNHSEMDHSGALQTVADVVHPEQVFASAMGAKNLVANLHPSVTITPVADGSNLSLGNKTLTFMETKMLHWPDSMFSYLADEQLLFSQDAFGMHLASMERFDDQLPAELLEAEAAKYYANILNHLSPKVQALLQKVKAMNLPLKLVATDHGPVWRDKIAWIVELYERWSAQLPTDRAIVVFDTMWESTALMAHAIAEGVSAAGARVKVMRMGADHRSDVITELLDSGAFLAGSPTLNNNIFPSMADVLTYARGLRPLNKLCAAFGSYGWSGESVKQIEQYFADMKLEKAAESVSVKYVPDADAVKLCYDLGQAVGAKLLAYKK